MPAMAASIAAEFPGQRVAEKSMTLDVAQRLKSRLRQAGYRVVMTRDSDVFVSLGERVRIANRYRDAAFRLHPFQLRNPRRGQRNRDLLLRRRQRAIGRRTSIAMSSPRPRPTTAASAGAVITFCAALPSRPSWWNADS